MNFFSDETRRRRCFTAAGAALILLFAFLVLFNLGRFSFWQDEAETALLARSILKNGLPYSLFDGKWVTQFHGLESRADHLWYFTPWLPFYVAALGFKLFGFGEWAGRLPFALCGIASALFFWRVARRISGSDAAALVSLFLFVTNGTTLLYMRQCKYYPLYLLAFLLALDGILAWGKNRKGGFRTAAGFLILFHTNYLPAAMALAGFGAFCLFFREGRPFLKLFVKTLFAVGLLFGPFLLLAPMSQRAGIVSHWPSLLLYLKKMGTNVYYWNNQVFPLLLSPLFFWKRPAHFRLFGVMTLASWLLLPLFSQDSLRYNFHLLPLFVFWLGFLLVAVWKKNRTAGALFFLSVFGTNFFQNMPDAVAQKSFAPLFQKGDWTALKNYYLGDYVDPVPVIAAALEKEGFQGAVFLNHDQLPWEWYSSLPIDVTLADIGSVACWIGPHWIRLGQGPYQSEKEITAFWRKEGFEAKATDTGIPTANWDLNSPIRYKHFLRRFSDEPEVAETIRIAHRLEKQSDGL